MNELILVVMGIILIFSSYKDLKTRTVPHIVTLLGLLLVFAKWLVQFPTDFLARIFLAVIVFLLGWWMLCKQWFGGGDTKWFIVLILFVPMTQIFSLLLAIFIAGGLQAVYYLYKKQNSQPYVVAICIGYWWWFLAKIFF